MENLNDYVVYLESEVLDYQQELENNILFTNELLSRLMILQKENDELKEKLNELSQI